MINDLINGAFESLGAVCCWINVAKIVRDKEVKGVYWPLTGFFATWGVWNLYYYHSLLQNWSVVGALLMCTGNGAWVWLAIRYRRR